jgi:hypothetical protein
VRAVIPALIATMAAISTQKRDDTIVHTVSKRICAHRWAIGTATTMFPRSSSKSLRANASAPAGLVRSLPHGDHTRGQQQRVATLDRSGTR